MKENIKLGKRITKLRNERKMSRGELSMLSFVDYTTLMNIENGKTNPKLDTLERLSTCLGVTLKELFDYEAK
ncbi:helix-turn-helix domain-containing protein [Mariniplasma anaerobium]|uniref:Uncharacterized protein n=1 Tax=Mariniplasma anaerobium TaxID=2735436 RepID=A0A7U9TK24_9MOLU|nr:helix-turn-helix transcriptional regulator [Mariniplasma anaerobium]BCR35196.1 hypothetical protein MPAN_000890 [Mariniplasma anaerobium]